MLLLTATNVLNYIDRNIVSIIASSMQKDLGLSDAQLGFLLGTSFAVLYGVFGIAMGRIADAVSRPKLMASGLSIWSMMTVASGGASGFGSIAAARVGVGVGEAVATPCAQSMLAEYFPARNRSAVLAVYLLGSYLGIAGALVIGGYIIQNWTQVCHAFPLDACRLDNWRAAFLIVGLPGLLLAIPIALLREPGEPRALKPGSVGPLVLRELGAAIPPFTILRLYQVGGTRAVVRNILLTLGLGAVVVVLGVTTGDWAQWTALAVGAYSVLTWAQFLAISDRALHRLTFGCPTFVLAILSGAIIATVNATVSAWSAPYALRVLKVSPGEAGAYLGTASILASIVGSLIGGLLADRWKRSDPRAPVWVAMISLLAPVPAILVMLLAVNLQSYTLAYFVKSVVAVLWASGFAALAQDLVISRMRGTAAAIFALVMILISAGLGPYWVGKISTITGSLTTGLLSLLTIVPVGLVLLIVLGRRLAAETAERREGLAAASA